MTAATHHSQKLIPHQKLKVQSKTTNLRDNIEDYIYDLIVEKVFQNLCFHIKPKRKILINSTISSIKTFSLKDIKRMK